LHKIRQVVNRNRGNNKPVLLNARKFPIFAAKSFYADTSAKRLLPFKQVNMQPILLILAAGVGSRYGGLKQVDGMGPGGEAILEYSVYDAIRAGFGKVVFVIRKDIEAAFREKVGARIEKRIPTVYAFQEMDTALGALSAPRQREKPWGTGHAVLAAAPYLDAPFATINADDFYGADAFRALGHFLQRDCRPERYGMVAYRLANTLSENGAVSRGVCAVNAHGLLTGVVERTQIQRFPEGIAYTDGDGARHPLGEHTPVSMRENLRAEFYIPTVVNHLIQAGKIQLQALPCDSQWYGVTYPEDKATVQAALRAMTNAGQYPQPLW
jgi:NDP-sugar pyrophosphorylase family protein